MAQTCARFSTDDTALTHGITPHVLICSVGDRIDVWRQTAFNGYLCVLLTFLWKINIQRHLLSCMHLVYDVCRETLLHQLTSTTLGKTEQTRDLWQCTPLPTPSAPDPWTLVASAKSDPGFKSLFPDWSRSGCPVVHFLNAVDSFPGQQQSLCRVSWKARWLYEKYQ